MLYPVPFRPEHLRGMLLQTAQSWMRDIAETAAPMLEAQHAYTLMQDGVPIACSGAIDFGHGRALVWAYLGAAIEARIFRQVHAYARVFLDGLPFDRIEAVVEIGFDAGHRWVKSLGFVCEAPLMRKYFGGHDCALYARIR